MVIKHMHKLCTNSDQLATLSNTHARAKELPFHFYLTDCSIYTVVTLITDNLRDSGN